MLVIYMKRTMNIFYQETIFNRFPYSLPAYPLVKLPSKPITNLHYHNVFEIGYCYSGSGECMSTSGKTTFKKGDATLFLPFQAHYSKSDETNQSTWHFSYFDICEVFNDAGFNASFWDEFVQNNTFLSGIINNDIYPNICGLIKQIIDVSRGNEKNKLTKCRALIILLLLTASENCKSSDDISHGIYNKRITQLLPALKYIKANYQKNITVSSLADICCMSVSSFRQNFSKEIGMSPQEFLISTRFRYAKYYLENTENTLRDICNNCGFSDMSSFYRLFIKRFNLSPNEYRKQFSQKNNNIKQ